MEYDEGNKMKVLVNSLPKSGTHLLGRLMYLLGMVERQPGLTGGLVRRTARNPLHNMKKKRRLAGSANDGLNIDLDIPSNCVSKKWLHEYLSTIKHGEYLTAHLPYDQELRQFLGVRDFRLFFIYRDPRDVLISLANFHQRSHKPFQQVFNAADPIERWNLALEGIRAGNSVLSPLAERLSRAQGWIKDPAVCAVRFEDLIGGNGGGDFEIQRNVLTCILEALGVKILSKELTYLQDNLFYRQSATFHKGQIGQWKTEMSDSDLAMVNEQLSAMITAYGYADGNNIDFECA